MKCPCSFVVKHRWARYVVCFFFSLSHGNVSLKIFYLWESRKKVGENGAELGEGGSFAVPNVHRNPSMVVDNKLLVLTLFFFFSKSQSWLYTIVRVKQLFFSIKFFFDLIWYRKRQNFLVILWLFKNFQGLLAKTGSDIHRCDINQLLPEVSSCPVAFHSQWEKFISRKYGVTSVGKARHYKALPVTLWTPVEPMKWAKQYWRHLRCTLYVNYSELASLNFCTGAEDCSSF